MENMYLVHNFLFFYIKLYGDVMEIILNGGYIGNDSNTMEALLLTKNMKNISGVLIDVRKTLDDILVLSKYDDLKKNTLSNKIISQSLYKDIRKIKFPSHIFKYYIPKLSEFLSKYQCRKKIFIKLYDINNKYLDLLYDILKKYNYKYYYISEEDINNFTNHSLFKIGIICNNYIYLDQISNNSLNQEDIYIITKNVNNIFSNKTTFDNFL